MNELNDAHMAHIMKQVSGDAPVMPKSRSWVQAQMIRERFGLYKPIAKSKHKNRTLKRHRKKV